MVLAGQMWAERKRVAGRTLAKHRIQAGRMVVEVVVRTQVVAERSLASAWVAEAVVRRS